MEDERSATALKQENGVFAAMNRTLVPSSNDLRVYQRSAYVISSSFHSFESLRAWTSCFIQSFWDASVMQHLAVWKGGYPKTSTTESASSELSSQLQAAEDMQTSKVGLVILGSYEQ